MESSSWKFEFDTDAPATPEAGRSILYPLAPDGTFFSKGPDGVQKQLSLPSNGKDNNILSFNETTGRWEAKTLQLSYNRKFQMLEDWGSNTGAGSFNWDQDTASGGSISSTTAFPIANDKQYGRVRYRISNSSASRAGHDRGSPELSPGGARVLIANNAWFATNFFNPLENAQWTTGLGSLGSDTTTGLQTDGIFFDVRSDGTVSVVCSDGGIETRLTTAISLLSERWYRFEIELNETATIATFRLFETSQSANSSAVLLGSADIATNIPPATSNIGPFNQLRHTSAGVVAALDVWQDYFYMAVEYNFER